MKTRARRNDPSRRDFLRALGKAAIALPFFELLDGRATHAQGKAKRVIFFYFPDGVAAESQNGEPSAWHAKGSGSNFTLSDLMTPLAPFKDDCVFFNGLSLGPTDTGNHAGGAQKLLTATDHGQGESIDQFLAKTAGSGAPYHHLYLGAATSAGGGSNDKFVSYPSPGQSITPQDDPRKAFESIFGSTPGSGGSTSGGSAPDPVKVSVIDGVLDDMNALRGSLGDVEKAKLDQHLDALREIEKRIKGTGMTTMPSASCSSPSINTAGFDESQIYDPSKFPAVLKAQIDLMVLAMSCGITQVGTIQASYHTSELLMSRFAEAPEIYNPNFDMRSHQASHYGGSHDLGHNEYKAYTGQIRWWMSQFAYLLDRLKSTPDVGGGTMLQNSLVLLCSEVSDGQTHTHDNMPFILAGQGGGAVSTGRLLNFSYERHGKLLVSIAQAMGQGIQNFGDSGAGPLSGLLG